MLVQMCSLFYDGKILTRILCQLPLTRPKSPNLTRRKSCGDVMNLSLDEKGKVCTRAQRHSFGSLKAESANGVARKSKAQANGHCHNNEAFKYRNHVKQRDKEMRKTTLATTDPHESNVDIPIQS